MTLDRLWQLDATNATSNSNFAGANISENCAPSGINNALRSLGVMVTRELAFQAAAISASVSTNIVTSSTGLYVPIVGAGAINSFGVVPGEQASAAVLRILEFSSSASLSHGGSIFLTGGASRRTQPGDVGMYIHEGSSDQWREILFSRATGSLPMDSLSVTTITNRSMSTSAISTVTLNAASISATALSFGSFNATSISASVGSFTLLKVGGHGTLAQIVTATNATYTTLGTILPFDNSIPQNTEGDEVLTAAITPVNASSTLKIEVTLHLSVAAANGIISAAIFVDTTANAIAAGSFSVGTTGRMETLTLVHYVTAGSTTARTYKVRAGSATATDAMLNGDDASRIFGGVAISSMVVTEILPQ